MIGWREDNGDSRLRSVHLGGVASRDNSISGTVSTQRRRCWGEVESTLRVRREGWCYLMPALGLTGSPKASDHQRLSPAKI